MPSEEIGFLGYSWFIDQPPGASLGEVFTFSNLYCKIFMNISFLLLFLLQVSLPFFLFSTTF